MPTAKFVTQATGWIAALLVGAALLSSFPEGSLTLWVAALNAAAIHVVSKNWQTIKKLRIRWGSTLSCIAFMIVGSIIGGGLGYLGWLLVPKELPASPLEIVSSIYEKKGLPAALAVIEDMGRAETKRLDDEIDQRHSVIRDGRNKIKAIFIEIDENFARVQRYAFDVNTPFSSNNLSLMDIGDSSRKVLRELGLSNETLFWVPPDEYKLEIAPDEEKVKPTEQENPEEHKVKLGKYRISYWQHFYIKDNIATELSHTLTTEEMRLWAFQDTAKRNSGNR